MSARDAILARIQLARFEKSEPRDVPREYRGPAGEGSADLLEERLRGYRSKVRRVTQDSIADAIAKCLSDRKVKSVVVPEVIPDEWLARIDGNVIRDGPQLSHIELDQIEAVVTTCKVAIAETGTIVLTHNARDGRRALTLLPDYHVVVVKEEQVVSGVPDAVLLLDPAHTMTWVSGPSATSDIELNRVEGVHGPRDLEVILVLGEIDPEQ